jgi:hypothetical protein
MKSRKIIRAVLVECLGKTGNASRMLAGKPKQDIDVNIMTVQYSVKWTRSSVSEWRPVD